MMSLSEKAAQLDALSDGQEVSAANAAWQEAKNELLNSLTNGAVAAAPAKLAEIASAVRQAGTGL
jgi:hypothetical protein